MRYHNGRNSNIFSCLLEFFGSYCGAEISLAHSLTLDKRAPLNEKAALHQPSRMLQEGRKGQVVAR